MKTAAVVILYHPTIQAIENIQTYAHIIDKIFVFDNTDEGSFIKDRLSEFKNLAYFHDKHNAGIAQRLNTGAKMAIDEGYEWLLMMDQDSRFEDSSIHHYLDGIKTYSDKASVGLFGPKFDRKNQKSTAKPIIKEVHGIITSGTILNLDVYQAIGKFDEALFIDAVDIEYCLRVQKAGYKIIQFMNISLKHELGKIEKKSSIKTLYIIKKEKELHSPLRYYYMYRNNLYVQSKHKEFDKETMKMINRNTMDFLKKGLFYGGNSWEIIKYVIEARRDFKQNKMGKYLANT